LIFDVLFCWIKGLEGGNLIVWWSDVAEKGLGGATAATAT
jgi:hypothetical protein